MPRFRCAFEEQNMPCRNHEHTNHASDAILGSAEKIHIRVLQCVFVSGLRDSISPLWHAAHHQPFNEAARLRATDNA